MAKENTSTKKTKRKIGNIIFSEERKSREFLSNPHYNGSYLKELLKNNKDQDYIIIDLGNGYSQKVKKVN